MKRWLRENWLKIVAAVMMPVTLVYFDEFYAVVFAAAESRPPAPAPLLSGAASQLEPHVREIVRLLTAGGAGLTPQRDALDALKPQVDADLDAEEQRIVQQGLGSEASARHAAIRDAFNARFTTLRGHLDSVIADPSAPNVAAALAYAGTLFPAEASGLNASQLPHRSTSRAIRHAPVGRPRAAWGFLAPADTLRNIGGTPAPAVPSGADLAETPETAETDEINALAAELGQNPVRIFEHVRNGFRYEPYYGSVKGAAQTLRDRAGNDADLASLVIALLRASDIHARWVYGTVRVSMSDLKAWLGVDHPQRALDVLAKNDIPFEAIAGGGTYVAIDIDHVWVRAYVDNVPYRGAKAPADGPIDIDPSFKRLEQGPYQDAASQVGFDAADFLQSIRSRPGTLVDADSVKGVDENFIFSTLQGVGARIDNLMSAQGLSADQAFRTSRIKAETLGVLPASRPYSVLVEGAAYSSLPDAFRFRAKVEVLNADNSTDIALDKPAVELAGHRLTLSYTGAAGADNAAISANLAEVDFPAYLVNVRPRIALEGAPAILGTPLNMGLSQALRVTLTGPLARRTSEVRTTVTAGSQTALVLDLSKIGAREIEERRARLEAALSGPSSLDDVEGEILHAVGLNFFFQADRLNDITANALGVVAQREASLALVTHRLTVTHLFGLPFTARADSVSIDAARDVLFPVATGASTAPERQFLLTSGFTASALEHTSLVSFFVSDAISTVRALVLANAAGQKIFTISSSNLAVADTLTHPQAVIDEVKNIVQAGKIVTIPQTHVSLGAREVSAFIVLDPLLASSAFVIKASPFLAGGLALTGQVKAGELLALGPISSYTPILENGEAWFRSVAAATEDAGLEYIPAIAAINRWFAESPALDRLTTVASAIAISAPLNFVANLPGIFNVSAAPEVISPSSSPGVQDALAISASVTRHAAWTTKIFQIGVLTPVATFSGTTPALSVSFGGTVPDGDYSFRIEAQENPPSGPVATPRGGVFKADSTPPTAMITLPAPATTLTGLSGIRGTANDPNFKSYKVEVFENLGGGGSGPATLLSEKNLPRVDSTLAPWNSASIESGSFTIRLTVEDRGGNVSVATRIVDVSNPPLDRTAPDVSITSPLSNTTVLGTITVAATASDAPPGSVAEVQLFVDGRISGSDSSAPYQFLLNTNSLANGPHALVARARDTAGFLADSPLVTVTSANTVQSLTVAPNPFSPRSTPAVQDVTTITAQIPSSQPFTLEIFTIDGGVAHTTGGGLTLTALPQGTLLRTFVGVGPGVEVPWDGRNDQNFKVLEAGDLPGLAGTYEARLTAGGQIASAVILASPANPPPIVQIFSPAEFADVKGRIPVVGTVTDLGDDLAGFTVKLLLDGETDGPVIGSGSAPVVNGPIAFIDPTLLENDFYSIRLSAVDAASQTTTLDREINIVGNQKVGIFTLTFTDLAVPVQGIPITVTRTYDTRLAGGGDFGSGWRLDVVAGGLKVRSNKDVIVTLPDNRRARFQFAPTGTTDTLNDFTQGLGQASVFSPFRTSNYEAESTLPQWRLRATGDQDFLAIPTQVQTIETESGPVPQVTRFDSFYYDFTPYAPPGYVAFDQRGMEYEYSQSGGRLDRVAEPNGNFLTITNDSITHSAGPSIQIVREIGTGRILKLVDPDLKEVTYEYASGRLSASLDREINRTEYLYSAGRLSTILDPRGVDAVRNEYDPDGRLRAHIDAAGERIEFDHDVVGRQEVVTDRLGNITAYVYDDDGNVLSQTNALGRTRRFEYDAAGNETLQRDELGNETRSTFDARGNLLTRADPLGNVTRFAYNDRGLVASTTAADGRVASNEYDEDGNLIASVDPLGNRSSNEYDFLGRLSASVDPLGTRTEFVHNLAGYVVEQRVKSSLGILLRKSTFAYDTSGRQLTQTAWMKSAGIFVAFSVTETVYNSNGQAEKVFASRPAGTPNTGVPFTETLYNAIGQQETVKDRLLNATTFDYNSRGLLFRTTFPALALTPPIEEIGYDDEGNRVRFTDRNSRVSTTEVDRLNRPFKTVNSDGSFRVTTYDPAGRVIAETDERGFTTLFGYDAAGRRVSVTDTLGMETRFEFDESGRQKAVVDALLRRTEFEYDALGRQVRTIFPDGTFRSTLYDALGRRAEETDEAGIRTRFVYAATGELLEVQQPGGVVTRYEYDDLGRKTKQIDALGRETLFAYNVRNELLSRSRPLGEIESFTYDAQGNLKTRTDGTGALTTFEYNALNLLSAKLLPGGASQTFSYFLGGQRKSFTIGSETTTFTLDVRNRLASQTNPDGSLLSWAYDASGNRTRVQTPALTVDYTWTPRNELFQVFRGTVEWARYSYDAVGNRKSVAYVNGTRQELAYNLKNQLLTIENFKTLTGTNTNFLLDPALVSAWRLEEPAAPFSDSTTTNPLDEKGTAATASQPGFVGNGVSFDGTAQAFLSTAVGPAGDLRFFPSAEGTLVAHYKPATATVPAESNLFSAREENASIAMSRFYRHTDGALVMEGQSFPVRTGSQTWNPGGSFQSLAFRWGTGSGKIFRNGAEVASSGFNPMDAGNTTANRLVVGNHVLAPTGSADRGARGTLDEVALFARALSQAEIQDISTRGLVPVVNQLFSSYTYTVDPRGLRTKVVEQTGRQVEYAYDDLRRLTEEKITESGQVTTIAYSLDDVGNRLSKTTTRPGPIVETTTYAYNDNDELTAETTGSIVTTYLYNDNGETISKSNAGGTLTYQWDAEGRMVGAMVPGETLTFAYDVDGIRVSKTVNTVLTKFVVDKNRDFAQVLEERTAANVLQVAYIHGDDLISQERGADVKFYHNDGQLSTRHLTDAAAVVTDSYTYDAFGVTLAQTGSTPNAYLYTGEQLDPNVGFYYLRARYTNPNEGRFISQDPFAGIEKDPASLHKYLYVGADPINRNDPSGLVSLVELLVVGSIAAVLGGIVGYATGSLRAGIFAALTVPILVIAFQLGELQGPGGGAKLVAKAVGFGLAYGLLQAFVSYVFAGGKITSTVAGDFFTGLFTGAAVTTAALGFEGAFTSTLRPHQAAFVLAFITEFLFSILHGSGFTSAFSKGLVAGIIAAGASALFGLSVVGQLAGTARPGAAALASATELAEGFIKGLEIYLGAFLVRFFEEADKALSGKEPGS